MVGDGKRPLEGGAITPSGQPPIPGDRIGESNSDFCSECGHPLGLAGTGPETRLAVYWRLLFLVVVGCLVALISGIGTSQARPTARFEGACPGTMVGLGCGSDPYNAAPQLST